MYYSKKIKNGELELYLIINLNWWAIPLMFHWHSHTNLKSIGIDVLCFSFLIEHWNWDKLTGFETVKELIEGDEND